MYEDALERAKIEYYTAKKDIGPLYNAIIRIFPQLKQEDDAEDIEEPLDFDATVKEVLSNPENHIRVDLPDGNHTSLLNYKKMFLHFYNLGLSKIRIK